MITESIFWALVFALFTTKTEQPSEYPKESRKWFRGRLTKTSGSLLALVFLSSCASPKSTSSNRLDQQIAQADAAYRTLDAGQVTDYNNAIAAIARTIDGKTPEELRSELHPVQVKVDEPKMPLPLAVTIWRLDREFLANQRTWRSDVARLRHEPRSTLSARRPLCPATAIYRRVNGKRHLSLIHHAKHDQAEWIDICAQPRRRRPNRSDVGSWSIRRAQWVSEHASPSFDARADRNFPDGTVRSEQGNRVNRARFAINPVRVH